MSVAKCWKQNLRTMGRLLLDREYNQDWIWPEKRWKNIKTTNLHMNIKKAEYLCFGEQKNIYNLKIRKTWLSWEWIRSKEGHLNDQKWCIAKYY